MATLAALKKQMAALEAKVAKATQAEMGNAIAKVRKIMAEYGLTIEHLASDAPRGRSVSKAGAQAKSAKKTAASNKPAKAKGAKAPKYIDPASGVTWSGVGRAPRWIADASNRDDFLINKPAGEAPTKATKAPKKARAAKKATKPMPSVKRAMAASAEKKVARKRAAAKASEPEVAQAPTKKAASRKVVAKKASAKKAPANKTPAKKAARKTRPKKTASLKSAGAPVTTVSAPAEVSAG